MALPLPKTFRQDMPPAGGFTKPPGFPVAGCVMDDGDKQACAAASTQRTRSVVFSASTLIVSRPPVDVSPAACARCPACDCSFRKRSPARGPAGLVLVAGTIGVSIFGWWRYLADVDERK
jgi:hypothetical protein